MPELAEVEYFRKRWNAGLNDPIVGVDLHRRARVFRACDPDQLVQGVNGKHLVASEAAAKQMLFRIDPDGWLGIHLGMTGELSEQPADHAPRRSDHLILRQKSRSLVFSDPRMFGQILFDRGPTPPSWWTRIPPPLVSDCFRHEDLVAFLHRHPRAPIKSVLLRQERFPGIGNWMADEVLWRAAIHPKQSAGSLSSGSTRTLYREIRWVCRRALETIGVTMQDPPASWLFPHRWADGGRCPRTQTPLIREGIGGRTTCWSPGRQSHRK